jgi:hypothetical protein
MTFLNTIQLKPTMRSELTSDAVILMFALPSFARAHNDEMEQPCRVVSAAEKIVECHSGGYRVVAAQTVVVRSGHTPKEGI